MPLLTCPNDNAAMQTVQRNGVELDICPQCRGVWLDRGELEKLLGMARADEQPAPAAAPFRSSPPRDSYGERGEYGEQGEYGHRRKKRFDIFDIFD